jgi:hypothetical protein
MCQTWDICQRLGPLWWSGIGPFKPIFVFELYTKWILDFMCHNPSFGLATKARGCKVAGQENDLGVTSHVLENAKRV